MLKVTLRSSRAVTAQLLITPLGGLVVNDLAPTDLEPLSVEELSEALTALFTGCLFPAFEAVVGTALVVERGDEEVTLRHRPERA